LGQLCVVYKNNLPICSIKHSYDYVVLIIFEPLHTYAVEYGLTELYNIGIGDYKPWKCWDIQVILNCMFSIWTCKEHEKKPSPESRNSRDRIVIRFTSIYACILKFQIENKLVLIGTRYNFSLLPG
jgi:hypothetical protein